MKTFLLISLALLAMSVNLSVAAAHSASVLVLVLALYHLIKTKTSLKTLKIGYEWYFLAFVGSCLLSVLVNYQLFPEIFKSFLQIRWIIVFYATFYLLSLCSQSEFEKIVRIFMLVLALAGLYAFFQYMTGIEVLRPHRSLEMPRPAFQLRFRAIGFFNNPMTFGHSMALAFPMAFAYFVYSLKKQKNKLPFAILLVLGIGIGLFSSLTRGAYIGAFAGLLLTTFLIKKRLVLLPVFGLLAVIGIAFLTNSEFFVRIHTIFQKTNSLLSRLEIWSAYFEMFKDHPIFGIGLDMGYKFLPHYYELIGGKDNQIGHAHNTYLQFLATGGILCFLSFIAMNIKFLQSTIKGYHPKNLQQYLLVGVAGSIGAFLVGGLTECNYIDSEVRFNYIFYLAIAATIIHKMQRGKNESNSNIL
jgi:O-antigen ligase